jgi:tRNA threonylcarbamoyl adenosine modification protein (Sua5/YciO/YrdC/YwlC family)
VGLEDDAVSAIARGDLVVLPTETVYGVAAKVDRADAIERIFELKGRDTEKVLQALCPDASWLERLGDPSNAAAALARAFWPGPLTLVVRARDDAPGTVVKDGTVGVRVPDSPATLAVLRRSGAVAATSANRSGEPTPDNIDAIRELFGDAIAVYLDGGAIVGTGSTVIDLSSDEPKLLREGPISFDRVKSVLAESI